MQCLARISITSISRLSKEKFSGEISQAINKKLLTKSGGDWLRTAVDGFHDYAIHSEGFPDANSALSVVQSKTNTLNITAPGPSTSWDCLIMNLPLNEASYVRGGNVASTAAGVQFTEVNSADLYPLSAFIVSRADSGAELVPTASYATWDAIYRAANGTWSSLDNKSSNDGGRLVAQSFEVHNTTASINKAGTVTVGEMPAVSTEECLFVRAVDETPDHGVFRNYKLFARPPSTIAEAIEFPNTQQWKAADGVYCVNKMADIHPKVSKEGRQPIMLGDYLGQIPNDNLMAEWEVSAVAVNAYHIPTYQITEYNNFNMNFAFFTGLTEETTLTLTTRSFYEYFPTVGSQLITMTTPSPPYDYKALSLYSDIIHHLPSGVPVGMNPAGEFFSMIKNIIKKALPIAEVIGTAINPAAGGAITSAGQIIRPILDYIPDRPRRRKKPAIQNFGGVAKNAKRNNNRRRR